MRLRIKKSIAVAVACLCLTQCAIATNEQSSIQEQLHNANSELESLTEQKESLRKEAASLQEEISLLQEEIEIQQAQVDAMDLEILTLQDELALRGQEFNDRLEAYSDRVRLIEEQGTTTYWEVIFNASSLSDLVNRLCFTSELIEADSQALDALAIGVEEAQTEYDALSEKEMLRKSATLQLQSKKNELNDKIQQRIREINAMEEATGQLAAERETLYQQALLLRMQAAGSDGTSLTDAGAVYARFIKAAGYQNSWPRGSEVVRTALGYLGCAYVWGGESLEEGGFDCSGFTYQVFSQLGYPIERRVSVQYNGDGTFIDMEELMPGDIVFFANTYTDGISHEGIYIGSGLFIHAAGQEAGVKISSMKEPYYMEHYAGAKRII